MSPAEVAQLENDPVPFGRCPNCDQVFVPFLRGQVQRRAWKWWPRGRKRPYCALICRHCKQIVAWEMPLPPCSPEWERYKTPEPRTR